MMKNRRYKLKKILVIIAAAMLLSSCGNIAADLNSHDDTVTVYASFYAMEQFVKAVGGTKIVYHSVAPLGSEPHDFEPTAADIAKLNEADVFVYNGNGIDDWAKTVADTLPDTVETVCASGGLTADGSDPHTWLNLYNAQMELEAIYKAMSTADSANAQYYLDNLTAYAAKIDALESEYRGAGLSGKKLFVTHGAYGYLCEEFGMEQIALEGISGDSDPSPKQVADVVEQIKTEGAKCIFYDPSDGDKIASAVAKEAGVEVIPLYTFESDNEHRDYIEIMQINLENLKKGLQ